VGERGQHKSYAGSLDISWAGGKRTRDGAGRYVTGCGARIVGVVVLT